MKKSRTKQSQEKSLIVDKEVKIALLEATMRLLSSEGKEGATTRAICAEVGVTAPTMYHHYGDLASLHSAAINETYRQVGDAYREGTKSMGPLHGLRQGWARFHNFAHKEPLMCRLVIDQIAAGQPPSLVATTLENVTADLKKLEQDGLLKYSAEDTVRLLWMLTLGGICFTTSERQNDDGYPRLQDLMIEITLDGIFKKTNQ